MGQALSLSSEGTLHPPRLACDLNLIVLKRENYLKKFFFNFFNLFSRGWGGGSMRARAAHALRICGWRAGAVGRLRKPDACSATSVAASRAVAGK